MAQQRPEDSTIDQIVQLVYPLSAEEHDRVVDKIRLHWHLPAEPREPWAQQNELSEGRLKIVLETERKVLKLADRMTGRDQEKLLDELKLVWLRRAVDEGAESLRQHGGIPAEEVFAELEKRAKARSRNRQQCHSESGEIGDAGRIVLEPSPGYSTMDSAGKKEQVKKGGPSKLSRTESSRVRKVKQMFEEWLQDSSGYDEETWPELKRALNENHSKSHKLFDE